METGKKRKEVRPSMRFEIFKRDGFGCQYCGQRSPDVVLEIDHMVPVSKGGGNEPENLITSCYLCNRGKSATPLSESLIGQDLHDRTVYALEREMQVREYYQVMGLIQERENQDIEAVFEYWGRFYDDPRSLLDPSSIRMALKTLSRFEVIEASEIAINRMRYLGKAIKYFYGVLHNKRRNKASEEGQ